MLKKQTCLLFSRGLVGRNCVNCSTLTLAPLFRLSSSPLPKQYTSCVTNVLLTCRMCLSVIGTPTPVRCFDLRQHALEKRRRREMEMAGLDPENDDDDTDGNNTNTLGELQSELNNDGNNNEDDEVEERRRMEEERRRQYMEKCQRENAEKRAKFREFRARQIAMSQNRKAEQDARKREKELHRARQTRLLDESNEQASAYTSHDGMLHEEATATAVEKDIDSTDNLSTDDMTNKNDSESTKSSKCK